jgi:hypothetical protein
MFMKLNVWVLGIALLVITSASAYPQVAPWSVFLGSTTVDGSFDRDTIRVGRGAGTFRAVQLRVVGGPVNLRRLVVRYGDGTREELRVYSVIPSGGRTRPIPLSGYRRSIRSVDLWYGRVHSRTRPTVSVHGIQ